MDFVTPILDIFNRLWDCTAKNVNTIKDLKPNVKALDCALDQLKDIKEDVSRRVQLAEERQMVRTKQVDGWLKRVKSLEKEIKDVPKKVEQELQRSWWSCCPNSCWSRYKLGDYVKEKLKTIDDLKNEGKYDVVADQMPRGLVDERPLEDKVGLNQSFEVVKGWITDNQVKIIGIHGMGGVGKTTLLTMVNNDFVKISYGFDVVLWVVVSKEANMHKMQETICEQLKLPKETWKDKSDDQKLVMIFRVLRTKKFVIMLDDLWERLDLTKVGIPTSDDQMYKIVFTTRSIYVCGQMGANKKIEIGCLGREESFNLFKKKVGMSSLNAHPSIPKLAESIAEECKGLPLALVVLGRAMSSKCNPRDWDRALEKLRKNPSEITDMDNEVFRILRFSYDNLRGDIMKSCFIYCCLGPEDWEIAVEDLLDLWIGEGFLDEFEDVHEARDRGREIVEELKAASLLEKGKFEVWVKLHDVIRDMALWISRGCQGKINKYIVLDRVELLEVQSSVSMTTADKISVWGGRGFSDKPNIHSSQNASTFILRFTEVEMLPSGLVLLMPAIKVLDLAWNSRLTTLPQGIGGLVELEFLNIRSTSIKELPLELNNLIKMKFLLLDDIEEMTVIPRKLISSFSLLRVFRISKSASQDNTGDNILSDGGSELLEELESLQHISDISIKLSDAASVNKLQHSSKLQNCVSALYLWELEDVSSVELSSFVKGLRNLESLAIAHCEKLTINCEHGANFNCLGRVEIGDCNSLVHLTWLAYVPALEFLHVHCCGSMVEIVEDHVEVGPDLALFSRLKRICLINMPSLRSICHDALPFDSLVVIYVRKCPSLRRLPFDSSSGKGTLKEINGEREWWDQLQWDDQTHKSLFRPYCVMSKNESEVLYVIS